MDRRSFLTRAAAVVAAPMFIPAERLLMGVPRTPAGLVLPSLPLGVSLASPRSAASDGVFIGMGRPIELSARVRGGALRVQTSSDGRTWFDVPDALLTPRVASTRFVSPLGHGYLRTVIA